MNSISYLDIGIAVVVLALGLRGLRNGFISEVMGLVGVVGGIYLASRFFQNLAHYLELAGLSFQNETILWALAFIIILSLFWIACMVLSYTISRFLIVIPELYIVNCGLGYVFSALKFFVILSVIIHVSAQVGFIKTQLDSINGNSRIYPMMREVAEKIMNIEEIKEIRKQYEGNASRIKKDIGSSIEKTKQDLLESVKKD